MMADGGEDTECAAHLESARTHYHAGRFSACVKELSEPLQVAQAPLVVQKTMNCLATAGAAMADFAAARPRADTPESGISTQSQIDNALSRMQHANVQLQEISVSSPRRCYKVMAVDMACSLARMHLEGGQAEAAAHVLAFCLSGLRPRTGLVGITGANGPRAGGGGGLLEAAAMEAVFEEWLAPRNVATRGGPSPEDRAAVALPLLRLAWLLSTLRLLGGQAGAARAMLEVVEQVCTKHHAVWRHIAGVWQRNRPDVARDGHGQGDGGRTQDPALAMTKFLLALTHLAEDQTELALSCLHTCLDLHGGMRHAVVCLAHVEVAKCLAQVGTSDQEHETGGSSEGGPYPLNSSCRELLHALRISGEGQAPAGPYGRDGGSTESALLLGCVALVQRRLDDARDCFRGALARNPACIEAVYGVAQVLLAGGALREGRDLLLSVASAVEPSPVSGLRRRTQLCIPLAPHPTGGQESLSPPLGGACPPPVTPGMLAWELGAVCARLGEWELAGLFLEELLKQYRAGDREPAVVYYGAPGGRRRRPPDRRVVMRAYAACLVRGCRFGPAVDVCDAEVDRDERAHRDPDPAVLLYKAEAVMRSGDGRPEAAKLVDRAIEVLHKTKLLADKGRFSSSATRPAEPGLSEPPVKRMRTSGPGFPAPLGDPAGLRLRAAAYSNKALLLAAQGRLGEACRYLTTCVQLVPTALPPAFNYVLVLWRLGKKDFAACHWLKVRQWSVQQPGQYYSELLGDAERLRQALQGSPDADVLGTSGLSPSEINQVDVLMLTHWTQILAARC